MNNPQYEKIRTIRIKDLFVTVCQRWRSLIICLIIGAVVLGAYGWVKSVDNTISTKEQAEILAESLGSRKAGVIESYAEDIINSTEQLINQGEYNKNALIMKLDPFHLYVYELKFFIGDEENAGYYNSKCVAIIQAYVSTLQDGFLGQKLKAVTEEEVGEKQREFYESPNLIKVDTTNQNAGILSFLLYFEEDEDIDIETVSQLKAKMQETKSSVEAELGSHILSLIGESSYAFADMDILQIQEANAQRINDLMVRIDTVKSQKMDADEQSYLNYLISETEQIEKKNDTVRKTSHHISIKYIALGAVLGVILAVIVIIIKYIATNSIKNAKEIEEDFGLQLIGEFEGGNSFYRKRKTGLDKWLRNKKNKTAGVMSEAKASQLITARIRIEAGKKNLKKIGLVIDKGVNQKTKMLDSIAALLGQDVQLKVIKEVFERTESLKELAEMDGAILVEQVDSSRYDDIRRTIALCDNYQIQVIGSIVAE